MWASNRLPATDRPSLRFVQCSSALSSRRISEQEGRCGLLGTRRDLPGARALADVEQQAEQFAAPQQPEQLLGRLGRVAVNEAGGCGAAHDLAQRAAACRERD